MRVFVCVFANALTALIALRLPKLLEKKSKEIRKRRRCTLEMSTHCVLLVIRRRQWKLFELPSKKRERASLARFFRENLERKSWERISRANLNYELQNANSVHRTDSTVHRNVEPPRKVCTANRFVVRILFSFLRDSLVVELAFGWMKVIAKREQQQKKRFRQPHTEHTSIQLASKMTVSHPFQPQIIKCRLR